MKLAIDTSSEILSIALESDNNILLREDLSSYSHIEGIDKLTLSLLSEAQKNISQLKEIIIGKGPGSFTGLKTGFSFAKALAISLNMPLTLYSSLKAIVVAYLDVISDNSLVIVIQKASKSQSYLASYLLKENKVSVATEERVVNNQDLNLLIIEIKDKFSKKNAYIISDNKYKENIIDLQGIDHFQIKDIAKGLLLLSGICEEKIIYEPNKLALATPLYIKPVGAKKIRERL